MSAKTYDRELLAYKVRWEGGVLATLDYGLKAEDIGDPELRSAWAEMRELHQKLRPLVSSFESLLREPAS